MMNRYVSTCLLVTIILFSLQQVASQAPELPEFDNSTYYGYEYGSSGILLTLLRVLENNLLPGYQAKIQTSLTNGLSFIWDHRIENETSLYPTWSKDTTDNLIYPSTKYGAAGIIPLFLEYYQYSNDSVWLDRASSAFNMIMQQVNHNSTLPNWGYAYTIEDTSGIPITDIKYGSAGILETAINLYQVTLDQKYLDLSSSIIQWLENVSINYNGYDVLPWYYLNGSEAPINLSYGWGNSGIATILLKYGLLTHNNTIVDWAKSIGNFIVSEQLGNGGWSTDTTNSETQLGFDNGVIGILHALYELDNMLNSSLYSPYVTNGIDYVFSNLRINSTVFGIGDTLDATELFNGYYHGLLGFLDVMNELSAILQPDQLSILKLGFEWMISQGSFIITDGSNKLLFPKFKPNFSEIIDFSLSDGVAGSLLTYVNANLSQNSFFDSINTTKLIEGTTLALIHFQGANGEWAKQRSIAGFPIESANYYTYSTNVSKKGKSLYPVHIMMLATIVFIISKKRNNSD